MPQAFLLRAVYLYKFGCAGRRPDLNI